MTPTRGIGSLMADAGPASRWSLSERNQRKRWHLGTTVVAAPDKLAAGVGDIVIALLLEESPRRESAREW